jgi:hypothetical protein
MRAGIGPEDEFLGGPLLRLAPPVFSWSASVGLTKTRGRCLSTERHGELTPRGRLRLEAMLGQQIGRDGEGVGRPGRHWPAGARRTARRGTSIWAMRLAIASLRNAVFRLPATSTCDQLTERHNQALQTKLTRENA